MDPSSIKGLTVRLAAALILLLSFCETGWVLAADTGTGTVPGLSADKPIQITADELVADNRNRTAEFIGNVKAVQGDVVIQSKRLQIVYSETGGGNKTGLEGKIDTIAAAGDVTIQFGNRVATTDRAEYRSSEGVLILSGEGSRVVEGDNSITGSRITLYRESDRITVEGGEEGRVKVIFFPSSQSQN